MRLWTLLAFSGTFLCGLLLPLTYCAEEQRIPEGKGANNCAITYSKHILSRCHSVTTAMAMFYVDVEVLTSDAGLDIPVV